MRETLTHSWFRRTVCSVLTEAKLLSRLPPSFSRDSATLPASSLTQSELTALTQSAVTSVLFPHMHSFAERLTQRCPDMQPLIALSTDPMSRYSTAVDCTKQYCLTLRATHRETRSHTNWTEKDQRSTVLSRFFFLSKGGNKYLLNHLWFFSQTV